MVRCQRARGLGAALGGGGEAAGGGSSAQGGPTSPREAAPSADPGRRHLGRDGSRAGTRGARAVRRTRKRGRAGDGA